MYIMASNSTMFSHSVSTAGARTAPSISSTRKSSSSGSTSGNVSSNSKRSVGGITAKASVSGGVLSALEQSQQKKSQQRKRVQQQLVQIDVPDTVRTFCGALYDRYSALRLLEDEVDESTDQLIGLLNDTHINHFLPQNKSSSSHTPSFSRKKLRVYIYNTHSNQSPPYSAHELHAPGIFTPQRNPFDQNNEIKSQPLGVTTPENFSRRDPPTWTFYIKAAQIDKRDGTIGVRFSNFFDRVMIITPDETVTWEGGIGGLGLGLGINGWGGNRSECDGIEMKRIGDRDLKIRVLFFLKYHKPMFSLSPQLSSICQNKKQASLCSIFRSLWTYILQNQLHIHPEKKKTFDVAAKGKENHLSEDESLITCNDALRQIVGVSSFRLSDLPKLLSPHLFPPKPVVLHHYIRVSGDWIETEQTYEFSMECTDAPLTSITPTANGYESIGELAPLLATLFGSSHPSSNNGQNLASNNALSDNIRSSSSWLNFDSWQHPNQVNGGGNFAEKDVTKQSLRKLVSIDSQLLDIDCKILETICRINQRTLHRNLYLDFSRNPYQFLNDNVCNLNVDSPLPLLSKSFSPASIFNSSRSFISRNKKRPISDADVDFSANTKMACYYRLPWVQLCVNSYLNSLDVAFEDQILRTLHSYNLHSPPVSMIAADSVYSNSGVCCPTSNTHALSLTSSSMVATPSYGVSTPFNASLSTSRARSAQTAVNRRKSLKLSKKETTISVGSSQGMKLCANVTDVNYKR